MREHYLSPDEETIANDLTRKGLQDFLQVLYQNHLVECRRGAGQRCVGSQRETPAGKRRASGVMVRGSGA